MKNIKYFTGDYNMLNVDTIRESEKISHEKIYSEKQLYEQGSWLAKPVKTVMVVLEELLCLKNV